MSMRHSDSDGSDIFWPGYVDAVTNLVLNLLFLLTVMTVAVFMFALELGRASRQKATKPPVSSTRNPAAGSRTADDLTRENTELKLEVQRLNMQLARRTPQPAQAAQPVQPRAVVKTVDVTSNVSKPAAGIDRTLASESEIIVRFADDAVAFTTAEHDRLLETLKPVAAGGKASIIVEVPAGFSEAKRMGFYRVLAVRNLLIEMKMPKEAIHVAVLEGKRNTSAAIVRVRWR